MIGEEFLAGIAELHQNPPITATQFVPPELIICHFIALCQPVVILRTGSRNCAPKQIV
jgi:hypothetical protein